MLEKLRKALEAALKRMKALNDGTVDEKGTVRSLTADEQKEYEELEKKVEETRAAIKRAETAQEHERELQRLDSATSQAVNITVTRDEKEDEKGRYRGFKSLGDQLRAARQAASGQTDSRLHEVRAAAGMNSINESEGGFLVQSDFTEGLLQSAFDNAQIASLCRRVTISNASNSIEYPALKETSRGNGSRQGGISVAWGTQAGTISSSKPDVEYRKLALEKMVGLCYATDEMVADVPFLTTWIARLFGEEFGFQLDAAIFEGDGAGKPLGIMESGALVNLSKKSGQAADTIVAENIFAMYSAMIPRRRQKAVWLINPFAEAQLPGMTVGNQPIYVPPGGISNSPYSTLYGKPVIPFEPCSKLGDSGDIVFAAMDEYLLAEKGTLDQATSIHVKFETAEQGFRFILRTNGHPLLRSSITPLKGNTGDKFSAFVTIENRT